MAHEVGHAIADDCIRAFGKSYNDSPHDIDEVQAYVPQLIVYDSLGRHPNKRIAEAAQQHRADTFVQATGSRSEALHTAQAIFDRAQSRSNRRTTMDALMGVHGPKTIAETLTANRGAPIQAEKLTL